MPVSVDSSNHAATRMALLSSTSANHPNKQHAAFTPFTLNGGRACFSHRSVNMLHFDCPICDMISDDSNLCDCGCEVPACFACGFLVEFVPLDAATKEDLERNGLYAEECAIAHKQYERTEHGGISDPDSGREQDHHPTPAFATQEQFDKWCELRLIRMTAACDQIVVILSDDNE